MTKHYRYHSRHQANATGGVLFAFIAILVLSMVLRAPLRVWLVLGSITLSLAILFIVVALLRDQTRRAEDRTFYQCLRDDEVRHHRSLAVSDEEIRLLNVVAKPSS